MKAITGKALIVPTTYLFSVIAKMRAAELCPTNINNKSINAMLISSGIVLPLIFHQTTM